MSRDRDLRLRRTGDGRYDLDVSVLDVGTVEGHELLVQALTLRLLTYRSELGLLGHPRYGSKVRDLIGEPMDRPNLGLLKRYVRKTLRGDPRVKEIVGVDLRLRTPGVVELRAVVEPARGPTLELEVEFDV